MLYTELNIGSETYKLRLNTRASIALEKSLGKSPLAVFVEIDNGDMPQLKDMIAILHACLQPFHHGFTLEKTYDLFDAYVEDGHSIFDLVNVFFEVFQGSGYIGKAVENEEVEEKN